MKLEFGLSINKKDIVTIVLLCVIFFSLAAVNLGYSQYPSTITQISSGQSFYIDLAAQTNVKAVVILLDLGAVNVTVSVGSPGNWTIANSLNWPYSGSSFSEDYNKYVQFSGTYQGQYYSDQNFIPIDNTTQYLKVDFGPVGGYETTLSQIGVIDQNSQVVPIKSITNANPENPNTDLQNLIDAQSSIQFPTDYMSNTYFDEIYFVRTAQQYINWQEHVLPYEWTHPPLGKLIQAAGILIFGFSPFGWRIMGVIFAMLMIPLMYLLGKKMLGTWIGGFTAAFLLTFDFMHFTMGRMGTADTYLVFFEIASQLFFFIYLKNVLDKGWKTSVVPLFLSFVFFSLGLASKFSIALFGFAAELVILLVIRLSQVKNLKTNLSGKFYAFLDRPYSWIVAFVLISIGIYFATYIPDMMIGRSFIDVINLQYAMYHYHATLTATHPFASPWFSWPLMFDPFNGNVHTPLWLQVTYLPNGTESTITLLGNPALWWFGFAAIIALTVVYVPKIFGRHFSFKANLPAIFIIAFFFFQWLPYLLITRVVFIYHFYSDVPFLCLGSAFVINKYWSSKWVKIAAIAYFALNIAMFILFYPIISGAPTTKSFIDSLDWFKGWILG